MISGRNSSDAFEVATEFVKALFTEEDVILLRPTESWTDKGTKRTKADYHGTKYITLSSLALLKTAIRRTEGQRTNLYFGVCPRYGSDHYDLAWQIRTVRALWADLDHISPEQALTHIEDVRLPTPSIVVNSGNGAHIYWLLDEAYDIDDVPPPPAVYRELAKGQAPRGFIRKDGEQIYLKGRKDLTQPSRKALHLQDILTGVARIAGGDHTTDLSRLLRVAGTLNRKNERNGAQPKSTGLLVCEAQRRYAIEQFESFALDCGDGKSRTSSGAFPLPTPRKITPKRQDKLNQLTYESSIAQEGERSETDFKLCCFAVRNGVSKDDLWRQVASVGKFAESGETYFDRRGAMRRRRSGGNSRTGRRLERPASRRAPRAIAPPLSSLPKRPV